MKAPEILLLASLLTTSALGADVGTPRANWETTGTLWESGTYAYDAAGNVKQIGADRYAYDQYGRLVSATANTPSSPNVQAFTYDRYGNLKSMTTTSASGTFRGAFAVVPSTNRLDGTCEQPYDVCHSRLHNPDTGAETGRYTAGEYQWDALGMLEELNGDRHERHLYDANDERIVTIQYTGNVEMTRRYSLRAADNKVLRELTLNVPANSWTVARDYVHRGSTLMASFTGTEAHPTRHYHPDHLGTPRVVTDADGYRLNIHTYLPFGREAEGSEPDTERLKFTGHERDSSGPASPGFDLDYMHARFYDPNVGRFLSVDPVLGEPSRPQTWNRYSYANNNSVNLIDPKGMYETNCGEDLDCQLSAALFEGARSQALQSRDAAARAAAAAYGEPGEANNVLVAFGATDNGNPAETDALLARSFQMVVGPPAHDGTRYVSMAGTGNAAWGVVVTFNGGGAITPANVAHEGVHVADALSVFRSWDGTAFNDSLRGTKYSTESAAYHVTAAFTPRNGTLTVGNTHVFRDGMNREQRQAVIDAILRDPSLGYNVSPANQGGAWPSY